MIPKLQEYMNDGRIPLFIRKRDGNIYFQMQIEVAREDGLCAGYYCEFEKITCQNSLEAIGTVAKKIISRFQELSDLSIQEFRDLTGMDMDSYKIEQTRERMNFLEVKTEKELNESFFECGIKYIIPDNSYLTLEEEWLIKADRVNTYKVSATDSELFWLDQNYEVPLVQ